MVEVVDGVKKQTNIYSEIRIHVDTLTHLTIFVFKPKFKPKTWLNMMKLSYLKRSESSRKMPASHQHL